MSCWVKASPGVHTRKGCTTFDSVQLFGWQNYNICHAYRNYSQKIKKGTP